MGGGGSEGGRQETPVGILHFQGGGIAGELLNCFWFLGILQVI